MTACAHKRRAFAVMKALHSRMVWLKAVRLALTFLRWHCLFRQHGSSTFPGELCFSAVARHPPRVRRSDRRARRLDSGATPAQPGCRISGYRESQCPAGRVRRGRDRGRREDRNSRDGVWGREDADAQSRQCHRPGRRQGGCAVRRHPSDADEAATGTAGGRRRNAGVALCRRHRQTGRRTGAQGRVCDALPRGF